MNTTHDISELLYPCRELTPEEKRQEELYQKATKVATRIVGSASPIKLLNKTEELYEKYLVRDGLK